MSRLVALSLSLGLFVAVFAAYALSPNTTSHDSRLSLHTAMSIAHGDGGDLTNYMRAMHGGDYVIEHVDGRPRNRYPIGPSLLALPGVLMASWLKTDFVDQLRRGSTDRFEMTLASIIGAVAAVTFFWLIYARFPSVWIAGTTTFIFAFCTSMWSTATRALWGHTPLVLMLVIAMLILQLSRDRPRLVQYVGLPLAFAFLSRPTAIVPLVIISAYVLLFQSRWFIRYLCWAATIAVPWTAYNLSIYGGPFPTYYLAGLGQGQFSRWEGFLGNLISPSRGLLIFSPILLLSVSGFLLAMREHEQRLLHAAYGLIVALMFATIAAAPMWWGGHSIGPRFTLDLVPFLVYFTSFNFAYFNKLGHHARMATVSATVALAVVSASIHARSAIRIGPLAWNASPDNIDNNPLRAWDWRDPQFAR